MNESTLKRDKLEPNRYAYLSKEDSILYDSVINSDNEKDEAIKKLLEGKAASSRSDHCRSTY